MENFKIISQDWQVMLTYAVFGRKGQQCYKAGIQRVTQCTRMGNSFTILILEELVSVLFYLFAYFSFIEV